MNESAENLGVSRTPAENPCDALLGCKWQPASRIGRSVNRSRSWVYSVC